MRYAKPAVFALMLTVAAALSSDNGNAATPATQPVKILLSKLPKSIDQEVDATDSGTPMLSVDNKQPRFRVIPLKPPAEYLNWFKQQADSGAFDHNQVEATPFKNEVQLDHSGPGAMSASVENVVLGKLVDWGWEVTELRKSSSGINYQDQCRITGIIEVDVRPDYRFDFPFEAKITCDPNQSKNGFEPHYPLHATVTWQKPQSWKKVE